MTENQAITAAMRMARKRDAICYVVYDGPDDGFQPASDADLDTWFCGTQPRHAVDRDGIVD